MNPDTKRHLMNMRHLWVWLLWALCAGSTIHRKAAGAVWFWLVLSGAWAWFQAQKQPSQPATPAPLLAQSNRYWQRIAWLCLALVAVPMLYWADKWDARHAEIRLALTAAAVASLIRAPNWSSPAFWRWVLRGVTYALALAAIMGLALVWHNGRNALPLHPIPWALGVSLISIWLLHSAWLRAQSFAERCLWGAGALCALMAVLASQSRGGYGLVVWWLVWTGAQALRVARHSPQALRAGLQRAGVATAITAMLVAAFWTTPVIQMPIHALQQAQEEYLASQAQQSGAHNTSFGARLYMWQRSMDAISHSIVWGHGQVATVQMIQQWGHEANAPTIQGLNHVHNQYLQSLIDHGLWGLASQLALIFGLCWLSVWLLRRQQSFAGWTLAGLTFMHATSSLSNVNFGHNYYAALLSSFIAWSLLSLPASE